MSLFTVEYAYPPESAAWWEVQRNPGAIAELVRPTPAHFG